MSAVSWSVGLVCLRMHGIPRALGRRAYLSVGRELGAWCVERLAVFVPSLPHPLLSTVYQCDGCLSYLGRGGWWLGCQVLPAISAVSILELVANRGSSMQDVSGTQPPQSQLGRRSCLTMLTLKNFNTCLLYLQVYLFVHFHCSSPKMIHLYCTEAETVSASDHYVLG